MQFVRVETCHVCNGKGYVPEERCPVCKGAGKITKTETLSIKIPKGIDDNARLRLSGKGNAGAGGSGDLYVVVRITPHSVFERDGDNLYMNLKIPFTKAALGDEMELDTFAGKERIKIHAGTQPGQAIRVKGKGMPMFRGSGQGDLFIHIIVEIPTNLTQRQKELLAEFEGDPVKKRKFFSF